jgi:L-threonylcarbamoyladenylate synthase
MSSKTIIYGRKDIAAIAEKICIGNIGILPTSTIYGISCIYNSQELLKKVYEIKKRPAHMPFITLIPGKEWLEKIACDINNIALALAQKYWLPDSSEPLTLVVDKAGFKQNPEMQKEIAAAPENRVTIALRVDPLPGLAEILKLTGPLISTSATISGTDIAPKTITEVPTSIREKVDFVFNYEKPLAGLASTIIDVTAKAPVLLREGSLKYTDVISFLKAEGLLK